MINKDCDCNDPSQCWEPCGELGHSEEHATTESEFMLHLKKCQEITKNWPAWKKESIQAAKPAGA